MAAALSVVWPGLGHFGHRNRRAWLLLLSTLLICAGLVVYVGTRSRTTLLVWTVSRTHLWAVIAFAALALSFRIWVAVDAYMSAYSWPRPQRIRRWRYRLAATTTLVMCAAVIAVPHWFVVRYSVAQIDLLYNVFTATTTETATPTPINESAHSATSVVPAPGTVEENRAPSSNADPAPTNSDPAPNTSTPTPTTLPTAPPAPQSTSTITTTTEAVVATTVPAATWDGERRLTVALLGGDGGFDRSGVRTDTIILVSIDVGTGEAAAFNIPREWRGLPFPEGTPAAERWPEGHVGLANSVYSLGSRNPEVFPDASDPAGQAIKSAIAQLTGIAVQYYVLIDMEGFIETIDLFGGVDVRVTERINDRIKPVVRDGEPLNIEVEPGEYRFDGSTALAYVRSRRQSSDYRRMARQRCVVEAFINQVSIPELLANFIDLANIISDHVKTDIPLERLDELVSIARKLDTSKVVTVNFIPPEFPAGRAPISLVREAVDEALQGVESEANASLAGTCQNPG